MIRPRRGRASRFVLVLAILSLPLALCCSALYTSGPRFGRSKPQAKVKPKPSPAPTKPSLKPAADTRKGTLPWPADGQVVTPFGNVVDPKYGTVTKNTGIDIATRSGSSVLAVDSGKVSFADIFVGYGRMVIIDHGNRLHSIYSRLTDVKAKVGANVARGSVIGVSGDTLHFEFRVGGKSVDPLDWLAPR